MGASRATGRHTEMFVSLGLGAAAVVTTAARAAALVGVMLVSRGLARRCSLACCLYPSDVPEVVKWTGAEFVEAGL